MTKIGKIRGVSPPIFELEASRKGRGISVGISGIISIEECSECRITMKSHGGKICIMGEKLSVNIYENNSVDVVGRVKEIGFDYGKG